MRKRWLHYISPLLLWMTASCSVSKFIPEGEYLLDDVKVVSDDKAVKPSDISGYNRQNPNSSWFSLVKVPMHIYSLSGTDTTRRINRFIQKLGDKPVIFDEEAAERSREDMQSALHNMGYMQADVRLRKETRKKKLRLKYLVHPGPAYRISHWDYDIQDDSVRRYMAGYASQLMHEGMRFDVNTLDQERQQMTNHLQDRGFYRFNKEYVTCTADTVRGTHLVDLTFHIAPYDATSHTTHARYRIGEVNVVTDFDMTHAMRQDFARFDSLHYKGLNIFYRERPFLKPEVLSQNIAITPDSFYSDSRLQHTRSSLGRLHAIKYTDIRFQEDAADSTRLDCHVLLSRNKVNSFSAELEGTNSAGDLGAAASLSYQNRNLFNGSELFTFKVRGAYEAVTGLQGYSNENYVEYGVEASINFPRFLFPFISAEVRQRTQATSEIGIQFNSQERPEFGRRAASVTWGYRWTYKRKWQHRVDVLDLNYVYMPWISSTFREEYLDNPENSNSILRYNYENLLIMKAGYGFTYHSDGRESRTASNNSYSIRFNIESSGNLLYAFSHMLNATRNEDHQYTVANIAYAQYIKTDIDFTKSFRIDHRNSIVFHVGMGVAYPYGNSRILPFEKRYFSGGANSVRGWSVRRLGPGSFAGNDRNIDFINQSGDIKLDLNLEYRTKLFWKLNGAFFVDAGNIWTIRDYEEQPGGAFRFDSFYKQIAVSYGLGLRFDFDYFILRFDAGMKAVNPAYRNSKEHYPLIHPDFGRDFAFHFAVGYPF
ncbi:MAG TPA: hypothetical protein DCZ73_07415 [Bacteroides sp.]|nr:BamA/TamA family outer membrane protein [Phocaeicola coprophilus]HBB07573.1 hypothetical protein [Bacteroides sp.]